MTVLALERFAVDASRIAAFEELAARRVEAARSAPGMLWAELSRATDDPPSYLVLVEWASAADADAFDDANGLDAFDPLVRAEITRRRFVSGSA